MKRYICTDPREMIPDLGEGNTVIGPGQWVRYDEAQAEIDRLRAELDDVSMLLRRTVRRLPAGEFKRKAADFVRRKCATTPLRHTPPSAET